MVLIFKAGSKNVFYQEIFLLTVCATDGQIEYKICIKCKRFIFFYIIHCLISSKDLACRAAGSSHNENCLLKNIKMNYLTKRHIIVDKMLLE